MGKYVLGIDAGTESVRTGVFDLEGNTVSFGSFPYKTYYDRPGWAEQRLVDWKKALINSIKKAIEISKINPKQVCGIGVDATCCTPVFIDKNNRPTRNPIMWMDMRSSKEASFIESIDNQARKYNGFGKVSAEWFPCKVLWVKKNQPEIYNKSKIIAEQLDWINFELTGNWTFGINTITVRGYYNNKNKSFPKDFYKEIGLEDLFDKLPQKILKLGQLAGYLKKDISIQTGLKEGIPIAQGGADAYIAVIGLNALRQGQLAFITGSSNLLIGTSDKEFYSKGLFGTFPDAIIDDTFIIEGGQTSTGSVLKWFKENFINTKLDEEAKNKNLNLYEYLNQGAEKIAIGSEGIIVLEHWQGNRTPFVDPYSKGVIRGLSLKHNPFHIYRAIMEGVAYGTETILRVMKDNFKIKEIIACGGNTKSNLWLQIYSDVTGLPIKTTSTPEAAALGSAILGAVAAGEHSNILNASKKMVHIKDEIIPDNNNHQEYKFFIDQYLKTYHSLKNYMFETYDYITK